MKKFQFGFQVMLISFTENTEILKGYTYSYLLFTPDVLALLYHAKLETVALLELLFFPESLFPGSSPQLQAHVSAVRARGPLVRRIAAVAHPIVDAGGAQVKGGVTDVGTVKRTCQQAKGYELLIRMETNKHLA